MIVYLRQLELKRWLIHPLIVLNTKAYLTPQTLQTLNNLSKVGVNLPWVEEFPAIPAIKQIITKTPLYNRVFLHIMNPYHNCHLSSLVMTNFFNYCKTEQLGRTRVWAARLLRRTSNLRSSSTNTKEQNWRVLNFQVTWSQQ